MNLQNWNYLKKLEIIYQYNPELYTDVATKIRLDCINKINEIV